MTIWFAHFSKVPVEKWGGGGIGEGGWEWEGGVDGRGVRGCVSCEWKWKGVGKGGVLQAVGLGDDGCY